MKNQHSRHPALAKRTAWILPFALLCACGGRQASNPHPAGDGGGGGGLSQGAGGAGGVPSVAAASGMDAGGTGTSPEGGNVSAEAGAPQVALCVEPTIECVAGQQSDFGTVLQSSWFLVGCKDVQGHDCVNAASCPNQDAIEFERKGTTTLETFPIGGKPGQRYKLTFVFNAIASAKNYEGGARDQGEMVPANVELAIVDGFYRDGHAIPSRYDSWKLGVFDEAGAEVRHFFMNSFPKIDFVTAAPSETPFESHRVFLLSYTKSIVVVGGGRLTYSVHDPNCHAIDNCGPGNVPDDGCIGARDLPNEPAGVLLPAMYQDPEDMKLKPTGELSETSPKAEQPWHSQLGHLTVTGVEATDDPVTQDYL